MNNLNVIGDIAGNFLTLKALLDKMPEAELLCLGDPNDRGPRSKEVIEFLMSNGQTVQSNHAHMFTTTWREMAFPGREPLFYEPGTFIWNGGDSTLDSYQFQCSAKEMHMYVPEEHIEWLENCPSACEIKDFVFTHAPLHPLLNLKDACNLGTGFHEVPDFFHSDYSIIWNRTVPERPHPDLKGKINVFGHNSSDMVKVYTTQFPRSIKVDNTGFQELLAKQDIYPIYGICLDTSSVKVLTGLHLPTMTIYQQEYID